MEIERLKMAVTDGDWALVAILKTLLEMLSGAVALLGFMDFKVSNTDSRRISTNEKTLLPGLIYEKGSVSDKSKLLGRLLPIVEK